LKGGASLGLSLNALTIHGKKYTIETSRFEERGKGRGKRTVVGAGGGAAVGAIIGAIAGGGKGAAIGAAAGGGAGTAGAAYTGERDISIPAETKISFKLRQSLTVSRD
jgi:outer membrane lipoprotein SlyB